MTSVSPSDSIFNLSSECIFIQHCAGPHAFCAVCRQGFPSSSALEAHVQSSHSKCPDCGKILPSKGVMQAHRRVKHPEPLLSPAAVTTFVCKAACGRTFSSKALRDEHVSTTLPACEHCHQRFLSNVVLQQHIASAHSQLEDVNIVGPAGWSALHGGEKNVAVIPDAEGSQGDSGVSFSNPVVRHTQPSSEEAQVRSILRFCRIPKLSVVTLAQKSRQPL